MPTDDRLSNINNNTNSSNLNEFQDILAEILVICQSNPTSFIIAGGDFNSDFSRNTLQVNELKQFCVDQSLESSTLFPISNVVLSPRLLSTIGDYLSKDTYYILLRGEAEDNIMCPRINYSQ